MHKCPHFGHPPVDEPESEATLSDLPEGIRLPRADTLAVADAAALIRASASRVIAIVGPSDSGKTSLIASLYDLFQEGAVAGVEFGRSSTLQAFEQVCHDARAVSRRKVPHMSRTPRGEVRFYHLALCGGKSKDELSLALADRAGEEYRGAIDDVSVVAGFPEVIRSDSLTFLVDGERLLDAGARHNLKSQIAMMIQAFIDGDGVRLGQRCALVLTKIDLIHASPDGLRAISDFRQNCYLTFEDCSEMYFQRSSHLK